MVTFFISIIRFLTSTTFGYSFTAIASLMRFSEKMCTPATRSATPAIFGRCLVLERLWTTPDTHNRHQKVFNRGVSKLRRGELDILQKLHCFTFYIPIWEGMELRLGVLIHLSLPWRRDCEHVKGNCASNLPKYLFHFPLSACYPRVHQRSAFLQIHVLPAFRHPFFPPLPREQHHFHDY